MNRELNAVIVALEDLTEAIAWRVGPRTHRIVVWLLDLTGPRP